MAVEIVPFTEQFLDDAAVLLAERHRRDRASAPVLSERFATADGAAAVLAAARRQPNAYGVAALRAGRLAGFLVGATDYAPVWGRSAWMRFGSHALAPAEDADLYRDLYAAIAPHWLRLGCFAQYVEMPTGDRAGLDAWFALSFGQQQAYALRTLAEPAADPPHVVPPITIRRAGPEDLDTMVAMQRIVFDHLGQTPVLSVRLPEGGDAWPAAYAQMLADPQSAVWLAEEPMSGTALGTIVIQPLPAEDDAPDVPEHCCYLALAATLPAARGRGISRALVARALGEARASGYACCFTDWRTTNLPSSRLWPRLGFRPLYYRLHRLIDDRIAWAPGLDR